MHIFFFITINGYLRLVSAALSSPLHLPLLLFPPRPGLIPHGGNQILTQWLLSGSNLIARKTVSMLRMPFLFTGAAQGGAGVHVHIRLHYHLLRSLAAHSAAAFPDSCLPGRPGASCRRPPAGQAGLIDEYCGPAQTQVHAAPPPAPSAFPLSAAPGRSLTIDHFAQVTPDY